MTNKVKIYLIVAIMFAMCIFTFLSLSTLKVFAYSGNATTLTEQQLYNETNTYNVNASCFNSNVGFIGFF